MKNTLLILFLFPLMLFAQAGESWLTPFADARFEEGKIVYSYCNAQELMMAGVIPLYYSQSLMKLRMDWQKPVPALSDVDRQQRKIRKYLKEENPSSLKPEYRQEYIRLAAMVLIWDLELDTQVMNSLSALKRSEDKQLEENAGLVLKLEEVYKDLR